MNLLLTDIGWATDNLALQRSLPASVLLIGCPDEAAFRVAEEEAINEVVGKAIGVNPNGYVGYDLLRQGCDLEWGGWIDGNGKLSASPVVIFWPTQG
jgi:hypothetical protein